MSLKSSSNPNLASSAQEGILRCLNYFGLFRYPLTVDEIHRFGQFEFTVFELKQSLNHLLDEGRVFHFDGFYTTKNSPEWAEMRRESNQRAADLLKKTPKYVRIIASFPFVRSIAISGSLSKFSAGNHADIDYFIITKAKRLWISRTLLHLYKKLTFLTNSQHYYCMNYFVDEEALSLKENNIYAAIELATLLPVYHEKQIQKLKESNKWVHDYLPNYELVNNMDYVVYMKEFLPLKYVSEFFLNLLIPIKLNQFLMRLTDYKWRRKWAKNSFPAEDYDQAFYTTLHVSKNHPENYEKKVLSAYLKQEEFNYVVE